MARRSAGEGAVYQRKRDGKWVGAFVTGYRYDPVRERTVPLKRTVLGLTRREAVERLARARAQHTPAAPADAAQQTLAQFAARYQRDVVAGLSRNTQSNVRVALACHILPALGHVRLHALRPGDIAAWQARETGAATSRQFYHRILARLLRQAVEWGELAVSPMARVRAPKVPQTAARFLTPAEARRVLALAAGDPWEALLWLALTVGPRRGELLALQWGDVDLQRATLHIQRNYTRGEVRVPKSPSSRRTVPLFPEAVAALQARRQQWPSAPWVFTDRWGAGRLIEPERLRDWWQALLRQAECPRVPFHSTRHAAGSYLLDLGMPLPQVSRLLGHASVAVTARVYSHALEGGDRAYVERLGELLAGKAGERGVQRGQNGQNPGVYAAHEQ